ncbi:hypothetical protein CTheo_5158 [Ceratobasidium theobromae]|uniref:DDE Tnp4 domain-containing protein n=1 Tax=Ceratobasidium theobromae TaxID=1582974 RepID=A0A5N5QIC0_9AGAM|nr:hypothetical protein CTheo_5158 [Ceratobasidium theobromae]
MQRVQEMGDFLGESSNDELHDNSLMKLELNSLMLINGLDGRDLDFETTLQLLRSRAGPNHPDSFTHRLQRLDNILCRPSASFELEYKFVFDELDYICDSVLASAMNEPLAPGGPQPEPEYLPDIRPTGRAHRERQAYNITCELRQTNFFERSMEFDNRSFRQIYRMSKHTFQSIIELIKGHPIFVSTGRREQRPVYYQLAVFLIRFGLLGSRAKFPALLTSVGEGTVFLYCNRVIRAIREFGLKCVGWPDAGRREQVKAGFQRLCGLDGIIGVLDGSLIGLDRKPAGTDASYISRKGTKAINIQAIVDHEGRFTSFQTGFPGSKNDTYVWKHSWVWQHRNNLFGEGEFLLADGGYPLSPYVVIPFPENELAEDGDRKREFSHLISNARVIIERTFGHLKSRFPSLFRMGAMGDIDDLYRAVEAIGEPDAFTRNCLESGEDEYDFVDQESADEPVGDGADINEPLLVAGREFRAWCMDVICPE